MLVKLVEDRGVELLRSCQLKVGGNMDFMNLLERTRLESNKRSQHSGPAWGRRPPDRRCASRRH